MKSSASLTNSALRAGLGNALEGLQNSLARLTTHLQFRTRDAWIWRRPTGQVNAATSLPPDFPRERTLELIIEAINDIKYADDQDPHESHIAPGVVVVSEEGIALADQVNRQKRALAAVLRDMQGRTEEGVINERTGERGPRPLREVALEAFYFRRLHHWQATRELVVLRESKKSIGTPDYVSFSWTSCREVRRTTRELLLEQLEKSRDADDDSTLFDLDIRRLKDLPPNEPLVMVRPGHTTPKANIAWPAAEDDELVRQIKTAVLPLIMLGERLPSRLRKLPAAPTPRHFRLARTDTEIEQQPLLETLPVYRYLDHVRHLKRNESSKARSK